MSYNIDSVTIVHASGFGIPSGRLAELVLRHGEDAPESSILCLEWLEEGGAVEEAGVVCPRCFWWHGEGSGGEDLLREVLAAFDGEADLVLIWEGGDSLSGLRLRDHVVARHEVVLSLGAEQERG